MTHELAGWGFRNNSNAKACWRDVAHPAGTVFFGGRLNWAGWVPKPDKAD